MLTLIEATLLRPEIITGALNETLHRLRPDDVAQRRAQAQRDLQRVDTELAHLARAIKAGGALDTLVIEVQAGEAHRRTLADGLASLDAARALTSVDLAAIAPQLRARLEDWRGLLTRHVGAARQILKKLIPERLVFTPHIAGDARWYTFAGTGRLDQLLSGLVALPSASGSGRVTPERETVVRKRWVEMDR